MSPQKWARGWEKTERGRAPRSNPKPATAPPPLQLVPVATARSDVETDR